MSWKGHFKNSLFALALVSFSAPQAEAIEIFAGANPAAHINDDLLTQVRGGRGGGGMRHGGGGRHHGGGGHFAGGGMHHGGGGMHHGAGGVRYGAGGVRHGAGGVRHGAGAVWAGRPGR
jgi:hypothetical protein